MTQPHEVYLKYKKETDEIISASVVNQIPKTLYEPISYVLNNGGKRIRPVLTLFSCEAVGGNYKDALNASVAIEMLHNFTLVHDDIMDNADTRRGIATVHKKWNENTAILTGDQLIGMAYSYLVNTDSKNLKSILESFNEGIIKVCEGQSFDKEFEGRKDVTLDEYLMMINKKTAKLLETSAVIGALSGNGNSIQVENLKNYAVNIGLAFQIQDDMLDITADEAELGKKIGGDLVEGKKTYLLLKAIEVVNDENDRERIMEVVNKNILTHKDTGKIAEVKKIYKKYGIIESAQMQIKHYTDSADRYLNTFPEGKSKEQLKWFSEMLMGRKF